jgi:hypothetical protein
MAVWSAADARCVSGVERVGENMRSHARGALGRNHGNVCAHVGAIALGAGAVLFRNRAGSTVVRANIEAMISIGIAQRASAIWLLR